MQTSKRKVYLWEKANNEKINDALEIGREQLIVEFEHSSSVELIWQSFKNLCQQTIKDHIPTKFTSSTFNQPWVNRKVICLSRKKKRQWKKARKSGKERYWSRYRSLLRSQKQECRRAYNSYVQKTISEELKNKPRRFWQFIKSKTVELRSKQCTLHTRH